MSKMVSLVNVLSVDLESWPHKYFLDCSSTEKNKKDAGYVCEATLDILKVLEKNHVRTTFFVLSEIYDWYPWLIYNIRDKGHEIGFHTHTHRILLHKRDLLKELKMGKEFIEEFDTKGFRAPEIFIREDYFQILKDWGFVYDSSIYSEFKIFMPIDGFLEVPVSTYSLLKSKEPTSYPRNLTVNLMLREIPFGSGFFIGLLGSNIGFFINKMNKKNIPTSLFMHPWQMRNMPVVDRSIKGSVINRIKMIPYEKNRRESFETLLRNHSFVPMIRVINTYGYSTGNSQSRLKGEKQVEKVKTSSNRA